MQAQAPSLIPRTKYSIEEVGSRTQLKIVFIFRFNQKKDGIKRFLIFSSSPAIKSPNSRAEYSQNSRILMMKMGLPALRIL
jgi:hypothetical protein